MRKLIFLGLAITLTISCEKDSPNDPAETNYYPLEIGNYWIYRHFKMPNEGGEVAMFNYDSVFIDQDSVINGNKYFVIKKVGYSTSETNPDGFRINDDTGQVQIVELLRDSSGYIVNDKGHIRFAENNFTDTLAYQNEIVDGLKHFTISMKMEKPDDEVSVPAGTFNVLNFKGTAKLYYREGNIEEMHENYLNCYFSNRIGKILDTYLFYSMPSVQFEKRLLRYRVA